MFRKHFLMGSSGLDSTGNIYGDYDWCVRYTAKKRIHPFGIPISDIKPILESQGYTVTDDTLYWAIEDSSEANHKYPVNLTHNVWDPITKEGIFGFIGPEPGVFAATMDNIIDPGGEVVNLRAGFNSLNEDLSHKNDYDVTKVICPDSTHITATVWCFIMNCYFFVLEDYIWPKNLGFLESHFDTIDAGCPYMKKPFVFKSTWTTDVDVGDASDFPSGTPNAYKYIVEPGNPVYDSRNDCGCIIKTETNTLMVGSTMGFVPDTVTHVYRSAFYGNDNIKNIHISDSVTSIGGHAFWGCTSLKNVYITDVESWCNIAFSNEYSNPLNNFSFLYLNDVLVTNLIIPDSVTSISDYAFNYCKGLTSIIIPDSVTSIGNSAFDSCSELTSITIGNSVTSIGTRAFFGCSGLETVTITTANPPSLGSYVFTSTSSNLIIYIPDESVDAYKAATNWSSYADKIKPISEKPV